MERIPSLNNVASNVLALSQGGILAAGITATSSFAQLVRPCKSELAPPVGRAEKSFAGPCLSARAGKVRRPKVSLRATARRLWFIEGFSQADSARNAGCRKPLALSRAIGRIGRWQPWHRMLLDGKRFMDPVTEDPANHTTEIWEFVNPTIDAHPVQLHAVHFQLLDRQPFDLLRYQRTSELELLSQATKAAPEDRGWKDTVLCPPGQLTRIIIAFQAEPGKYVWHCHTLEHEDNEMMRPYVLSS